jgi:hypothetical protein
MVPFLVDACASDGSVTLDTGSPTASDFWIGPQRYGAAKVYATGDSVESTDIRVNGLRYTSDGVLRVYNATGGVPATATMLGGIAVTEDGQLCVTTAAPDATSYFIGGNAVMQDGAVCFNQAFVPGAIGFGVGIAPALPAGFTAMSGYSDPASANYGNYEYSDGSVMVWIPAFYYRIGSASSPRYAVHGANAIDILPYSAFSDVATANAAGYALHRAFYDAGGVQAGFFVDKYLCSNNSGTASSILNGVPLSAAQRGTIAETAFATLTGAPANNYGGALAAAKTRGTRFFCASKFIQSALALLSLAHGQAASSTTNCAWYSATTTNFPKGCNNNAFKDSDDTSVIWEADGTGQNCGKTGSAGYGGGAGNVFAKSTHNGQDCGVADLNGDLWEINIGVTCVASSYTITAASQANPVQVTTSAAHGRTTGDRIQIESVVGMTQMNDRLYTITVIDATKFTLDGIDGTGYTAYGSGGTVTYGQFYVAKSSEAMKDFTGGNTLATDHWGATGVAANFDAFTPTFRVDPGQDTMNRRYGNSTNQVLSEATSGAGWLNTGLGQPRSAGVSSGTSGTNLFGVDYLYQYMRNELCLLSGGPWNFAALAGVWAVYWVGARPSSFNFVGFRAASYPD